MNSLLYSAPLLRILLPYMAGILASRLFLYAHLPAGLRTALLLGAAAAAALLCTLRLDFRHRWTGGLAAAALAFPLALSIANQLGVDPMPFFILVCVASSACFSSPIGYQTNLIVQGIGNYRFTDFVRVGLPLNLLVALVSILLIPQIWPFEM